MQKPMTHINCDDSVVDNINDSDSDSNEVHCNTAKKITTMK